MGTHAIPIDYNIVKVTETKNFEKSNIIFSITNNKHNSAATTYYLLLKKSIRDGNKSPADLNSEFFKTSILGKESSSMMSGNGNLTTSTQPASTAAGFEHPSRDNKKFH